MRPQTAIFDCLYGGPASGKSESIARLIEHVYRTTGKTARVCVGDGSAMYGIQGLWSAAHLKLPITYVIAHNRGYRIIKERLVAMQGCDQFIGMDMNEGLLR